MKHTDITLKELESNLVDINDSKKIPPEVLEYFFMWKENQGSIPTGISRVPDKGWYIISPALQGNGIIKHFSIDTK